MLDSVTCPFCKSKQKKPIKTWKYGKDIDVSRFKCSCGKFFNFYKSAKEVDAKSMSKMGFPVT